MGKPQEVVWDKQGMTWQVYGVSVDLDCLGVANPVSPRIQDKGAAEAYQFSEELHLLQQQGEDGVLTCCKKTSTVMD